MKTSTLIAARCPRDLLDHIIAVNERHLKRLVGDYIRYYHEDRTHLGLQKQTPENRSRSEGRGRILALPRLGGLHHRVYARPDYIETLNKSTPISDHVFVDFELRGCHQT